MITEDYVSFETAKLLKEKGFDEKCSHYWQDEISKYPITKEIHKWTDSAFANTEISSSKRFSAPTLQMAMKWLREVHNIHIEVRITNHSLSSFIDVPRYYWIIFNAKEVKWMDESTAHKPISYETVEEACEAAIKYCLEKSD